MISSNNDFYFNIDVPQKHPQSQSQLSKQAHLVQPTPQSNKRKGSPSPPFYHSSGASFDVTPVDKMTVYQTANWIRTLGGYHGWTQVEEYAECFINNSISGGVLQELTPEMLEVSIGMCNQRHQRELFSAIQYLYPNREPKYALEFQGYTTGIQLLESSCSNENRTGRCLSETGYESTYSYLISSHSQNIDETAQMEYTDVVMSESGYSQRSSAVSCTDSDHYIKGDGSSTHKSSSVRTSNDKADVVMVERETRVDFKTATPLRMCRPLRCRKLLLILRADQTDKDCCPMQSIRSRFQELKIQVEIEPTENKPNTYTLAFPDYLRADQVLSRADEIGYKLTKKYPPRPTPKRPLKYESMADLEIRTGKALSGDIVGTLKKGKIVTVNQVKGRRARLIKEKNNGDIETIGWVSLHEQDGINLLKQMGDF